MATTPGQIGIAIDSVDNTYAPDKDRKSVPFDVVVHEHPNSQVISRIWKDTCSTIDLETDLKGSFPTPEGVGEQFQCEQETSPEMDTSGSGESNAIGPPLKRSPTMISTIPQNASKEDQPKHIDILDLSQVSLPSSVPDLSSKLFDLLEIEKKRLENSQLQC